MFETKDIVENTLLMHNKLILFIENWSSFCDFY